MNIIDGKELANSIREEIADEVSVMVNSGKRAPHLAAVLIGKNAASETYVANKIKACKAVGITSTFIEHKEEISEEALLKIVRDLNENDQIDGFIVQLPIPGNIDEQKVTLAIDPRKDVDGFHPVNFGRMSLGLPAYLPATPNGIMEMIRRYDIQTSGKKCVVLGRSNIVGTPMAILMSRKDYPGDATVTICHSRTQDLHSITREADILIAAIGRSEFVTGDMVKEGVVVIDVGIARVPDATRKRGYRLTGDVHFESVAPKSSFITPVPGGVGPMTVISLLTNTLKAAKKEIYKW